MNVPDCRWRCVAACVNRPVIPLVFLEPKQRRRSWVTKQGGKRGTRACPHSPSLLSRVVMLDFRVHFLCEFQGETFMYESKGNLLSTLLFGNISCMSINFNECTMKNYLDSSHFPYKISFVVVQRCINIPASMCRRCRNPWRDNEMRQERACLSPWLGEPFFFISDGAGDAGQGRLFSTQSHTYTQCPCVYITCAHVNLGRINTHTYTLRTWNTLISHEISPSTSPADQGLKGDTCNRDTDTTGSFCLLLCIHSPIFIFCCPFLSFDSCFPICLLPFVVFLRCVIFLGFSYFQITATFSVFVICLFVFEVPRAYSLS